MSAVPSWQKIWRKFNEFCDCSWEYPSWTMQKRFLQKIITDVKYKDCIIDWNKVWGEFDKECFDTWKSQQNKIKELVGTYSQEIYVTNLRLVV
jgi:hypothetical protein